ncbi:thiamine pyrophosphate-requiring protein [Arthrobacter ginkgonis]|uniref:Thiamine pyrophosphate-requiring protein n=1 Tax=Arthrobacter ginkgonis TaxID=1630594 RepID=A0ABP7CFL3_9MICC
MAERLVADAMVERLNAWGVRRLFGYSGDGINTFIGALRRSAAGPEFVQARHEENAAFMAVAHSKYGVGQFGGGHAAVAPPEAGQAGSEPAGAEDQGVGVVIATQGPGAVHLLNGLYDAKLDGTPVVAIVGQQNTTVLGSQYQQEIDLLSLFKDVAAQFCQQVSAPEQVPMVLDRAFRTALATSSPCVVIVPHDVQKQPAAELEGEHGTIATAPLWAGPHPLPDEAELDAAARLLDAGERVMLLVGQGARWAREEVHGIAALLGAGIATSLLGKPYVDESLPYAAGVMGHLGTPASAALLNRCDTLLIVGSNDPWTEFYPKPGAARAVQIDLSGKQVGNRYPVEVALVGDAAATLRELAARLDPGAAERRRPWVEEVGKAVEDWRTLTRERALTPAEPVNPERVVHELTPRLPADAQLALDVGSCVYWYARQLLLPPTVPVQFCSTLASMGCGVPYGLAAKLRAPDRPVVVLAGDGGMQMTGIAELVTVAARWRDWADPRFVVCVFNNGDLAEVTWEMRETEGDPRYGPTQDLPDFPYARYAELLGMRGIEVTDPERLGDAWEEAFAADAPVVINVRTDPAVPLLAPFPDGARKLDSMRAGLEQEGPAGAHALELLQRYAEQEERLFGGD